MIILWCVFREDVLRNSNTPMSKSSVEMENHVFNKAKSRVRSNEVKLSNFNNSSLV